MKYLNLNRHLFKSLRMLTSIMLAFSFFIAPLAPVFAEETSTPPVDTSGTSPSSQTSDQAPVIQDLIPQSSLSEPESTDSTTQPTSEESASPQDQTTLDKQPVKEEKVKPPSLKPDHTQEHLTAAMSSSFSDQYWQQTLPNKNTLTPNVDDQTGALRYAVPVVVPPGRNGLQPTFNLVYNSQDRQAGSVLGFGWSVDIPYIERVNKTGTERLFTDTYFTSSLDGELATTSDATVYVPKVESGNFLKYKYENSTWKITDKSGTIYTFGTTTQTRLDNPNNSSQIYKWMLEEIRDVNGNYITYTYAKDYGQIYPSIVRYTANGATSGVFSIEFSKELRSDYATSSWAGFPIQTRYRINQIQAKINSNVVHKYDIAYTTGNNGVRSLVSSITETGKDEVTGVETSLPATTFRYATSSVSWADASDFRSALPSYIINNANDQGWRFGDINGDGLPDIVRSYGTTTSVLINTGSTWTDGSANWTVPNGFLFADSDVLKGAQLLDVDGDGKADLVQSLWSSSGSVSTSSVYLNNGHGWTWSSVWTLPQPLNFSDHNWDTGTRIADLNGDSLPDVLRSFHDGSVTTRKVYLNNGHGWTESSSWPGLDTVPPFINLINTNCGYAAGENDSPDLGIRLGDPNGDGLTDLVSNHHAMYQNPPCLPKVMGLNLGSSFAASSTDWIFPDDSEGMYFAGNSPNDTAVYIYNIDGDGIDDLVYGMKWYDIYGGLMSGKIYIANGKNGWTQTSLTIPEPFRLAEVAYGADPGTRVEDLNGDGLPDILRSFHADSNGTTTHTVWLNTATVPDIMTRITSPKGGYTSVTYKPSTQYKDGSGNLFNPNLPMIIQTVNSLQQNDGAGLIASSTYTYGGGNYYFNNPLDRKFAGFATTTVADALGNVTTMYYHQGDTSQTSLGEYQDGVYKISRPYRIEKKDASGNVYDLVINKWDTYSTGPQSSFVKLARTTELTYDGDASHKDKAEEYSYDNTNGNLTNKIEWGEVTGSTDGSFSDTGSDKRSTAITYAASSTGYVSLPSQETVVNQSSSTVAQTKYYYDTQSLGTILKGNLTKTEKWVGGSKWVNTQKQYNSYGLVIQDTDERGKNTTYTYDTYNLYPATTTNPLSHVTARDFDYSSGKVTKLVDPNGRKFTTTYDGLDRTLEEKQPDLTTPSTLVTKSLYTYSDFVLPNYVHKTDYLDGTNGVESYQYIDGLGRTIQTRTEGEATSTFIVADTVYDARGFVSAASLPYFSSGASSTSATTTDKLFTRSAYDAIGRPLTIANTVGTTTYAYDDWKTSVTDANGHPKHLYTDAFQNLIKVDEVNATSTYTTQYTYDPLSNLTNITDALSNIRNFTYDGLGRRLTAQDLHTSSDATFGIWSYGYDDTSNLASTTDPKAQVVQYTYDDLNRALTEDYTGGSGTEVAYGYDNCTYGKGKLCVSTTTDAITSFTYDALFRTATETKKIGTTNYLTGFLYDRQGNQTEITYPDLTKVKYTYNNGGQIETVQKKEVGGSYINVIDDLDYGPHGKVTFKDYANGTESIYTYDANALYRLINIKTYLTGGMGGSLEDPTFDNYLLPTEETSTSSETILPSIDPVTDTATTTDENVSNSIVTSNTSTSTSQTEGPAAVTATTTQDIVSPEPVASSTLATTTEVVIEQSFLTDGLIKNLHDARAWRKYHQERVAYLESHSDVPKEALEAAHHAQDRFEAYLVAKKYISEPKGEIRPLKRVIDFLKEQGKEILSMVLPERAYAFIFGTEDFESCSSLPCSFDANNTWGSVTSSLDHTSKVAGEDSLKEVVAGEGGGSQQKNGLNTSELWVRFKVWVPNTLTMGASGYFGILMLQDSSSNATIWLNVEDWGTARLTVNGDVLGYTNTGLDLTKGAVNTIEMRVKIGSSNGDIDIWLNNDTQGSPSYNGSGSMNTGTDNIDKALFGLVYAPESGYSTTYYDDVTVDDNFIGTGSGQIDLLQDITYTYDAVGNITKILDVSQTNAAGTTTYSYDDLNRLTQASTTQATGGNYFESFSYNALGNITNKSNIGTYSYTGNTGTNYANPHAATSIAGQTYAYDHNGNLTSTASSTYAWDYRNRLTQAQAGVGTITSTTYIYQDATTWDDWSWWSTLDVNNTSPVYEGSKSLKVAYTEAWGGLYLHSDGGIDPTGFSTMDFALHGGVTGGQDLTLVLYTPEEDVIGVSYLGDYIGDIDPNTWYHVSIPLADMDATSTIIGGFSIESAASTTIYLDNIHLEGNTAGTATGTPTRYTYDHTTNRTTYFDGHATTTYANQYFDQKGTTKTKHLFANGDLIASIEGTGLATTTYTIHTDHLGGTNVVTDATGDLNQLLSYYPFGSTRLNEKATSFNETNKFTGHELDDATGLYYMQARYQNPNVGRFISQDPVFWSPSLPARLLVNPQEQNSYTYVANNPLRYTDPTGKIIPLIVAIGAVYTAYSAADALVDAYDYHTVAIAYPDQFSTQDRANSEAALYGDAASFSVSLLLGPLAGAEAKFYFDTLSTGWDAATVGQEYIKDKLRSRHSDSSQGNIKVGGVTTGNGGTVSSSNKQTTSSRDSATKSSSKSSSSSSSSRNSKSSSSKSTSNGSSSSKSNTQSSFDMIGFIRVVGALERAGLLE